ncbi:FMRF-amide neuropeptides-like [Ostrea edulis]|uniref:FMRF-amide neuropeptides-like n=1 Tax=Ostrea edulis TaxID=37623 RepID=UPI002094870B|nr:FMRF-amide neuropeptides-like [Ostrea edulis]
MLGHHQVIILVLFYLHNIYAEIDENNVIHPVKTVESAKEIHEEKPQYFVKAADKRGSGFFRIGKSASRDEVSDDKIEKSYKLNDDNSLAKVGSYIPEGIGLIQVVKDGSESPIYIPVEMRSENDETANNGDKRASGFFRIGKSINDLGQKRNFFRIGKSLDPDTKDKKASGFFRIGRTPSNEKRAKGFFRIGKSLNDLNEKRASGFFRIGKSNTDDKRAKGFFRIGKSKGFFRIGKAAPLEGEKKASGFFRIGRNLPTDMSKKSSGFFRIGKSIDREEGDKRTSGFFRIGKSCSGDTKRAGRFFRIGKSLSENDTAKNTENENTSSSPNQKSNDQTEESKRAGRFFRIGKRNKNRITKRSSGNDVSSYEQIHDIPHPQEIKRGYFRIGKVPASSFMRIGRQHFLQSLVNDPLYRDGRIRQKSFMRIGKRSANDRYFDTDQAAPSEHIL